MTRRRRFLAAGCILAAGLGAAACGSEGIDLPSNESANVKRGAVLFAERCQGCHTLDTAGSQGSATAVHDRELSDGPNFNDRRETVDSVLYAIRNGGFSGAIMPENLAVGKDAQDIAAFVAKYAGGPRRGSDITPESQPSAGGESEGGGGGAGAPAPTGGQTTPPASTTGTETTPPAEGGGEQAAAQGKEIFTSNCAGCHTLADANASARVGPNLDDARPDERAVQQKVEVGGGGMPAFRGQLEDDEISAVAQYVSSVAGR
ncbi:MAG TPA: c-type cytochrome [Solirubrobacteraceae bacterium]|nr:c-type cytochrome [Solirubrobacteraceae bacterium]